LKLKELDMDINAIKDELQQLAVGGVLEPEQVVEAARNPNSSMHNQFVWDDNEASHLYRLQQARALIKRVKVEVIRSDNEVVRVPVFVRSPTGSGYEATQQVVVRHADRITLVLMTLTTCATMLKNLAAPELDEIIEHIESLKEKLLLENAA
jgi:hypothetical protein